MAKSSKPIYRVRITNLMSVGTRCGSGTGATLEEAQSDALRQAMASHPDAHLSESGWEVVFAEPVRL